MPDHATLYCFTAERLIPDAITASMPATGWLSSLIPRGPEPEMTRGPDGEVSTVQLRLAGVEARINVMPAVERTRHLMGLQGYLLQRCELQDPELPHRIPEARMVLGLVFEPGLDEDEVCEGFLTALARRTGALIFRPDGTLADHRGQVLAFPATPADVTDTPDEAESDEDEEHEPPSAERVARRLLVVLSLAWRSWLEGAGLPDAQAQVDRTLAWLEAQGLLEEMEPEELALARAAAGSWSPRERLNRGWEAEGAAVLAWALRLAELPPHDVQVDPQALADAAGFFADAPAVLRSPTLRPEPELQWLGGRLLGLHWRLRDFSLRPQAMSYTRFASDNWFGGFDLEAIPLLEDDLAIGGAPIARAAPDAVRATQSIAMERHRAINWLSGYHPLWSEVDTST